MANDSPGFYFFRCLSESKKYNIIWQFRLKIGDERLPLFDWLKVLQKYNFGYE